jgi:hypothetical protein
VFRPRVGFRSHVFGGVEQDGTSDSVTYTAHRYSETTGITTMTKIILRDEVAALKAERDLLRKSNPTPTGLTGCFDTTPLELGCSTKQSRFRRSG